MKHTNYFLALVFLVGNVYATETPISCPYLKTGEVLNRTIRRDTVPIDISSFTPDYGYPVMKLAGSVFKLAKNYSVLTYEGKVADMGGWISPQGAGLTLLASLLSEASYTALNVQYEKAIGIVIKTSYSNLDNQQGELVSVMYNSNDFNVPDVTSVRYSVKGVGATPEDALSFGPIAEIGAEYPENAVFPKLNYQYIWLYKDQHGDLNVSSIREPFIKALTARAMQRKTERMKQQVMNGSFTDPYLQQIDEAKNLTTQAEKFKQQLADKGRLDEVNRIDQAFQDKQNQFNDLYKQYQQDLADKHKVSALEQFINACNNINSTFNPTSNGSQADDAKQYSLRGLGMDSDVPGLKGQLDNVAKGLRDDHDHLKLIYDSSGLEAPPPMRLPLY